MSIEKVVFGELSAESEKNLAGYFVDTGVLAKLAVGHRQLVIGRKGSGKTALFRLATPSTLQHVQVVEVEFDQYPWEFHRQLKQAGMMAESAYEASWRFLLLLLMAKEWAQVGPPVCRSDAEKLVRQIVPDPHRGFWASLLSRAKNPTKIGLPVGAIAGHASVSLGSIDLGKEDAIHAVGAMSVHLGALTSLAQRAYPDHPIVIKVDRLDDGWDASMDSQALIIGELKAARTLTQLLQRPSMPAPVITFLRSDIYELIRFNDKNKMANSIERLEWPNARLVDVLIKRIAASLGVNSSDAWSAAFSDAEMRQRAKPQSYVLRRTMARPRDVIAFAIHCRDCALANKHLIVETQDIYEAEGKYSQHLMDELSDELHKQKPELDRLLDTLRQLGRMTFSLDDWTDAVRRGTPTLTDVEAREQLAVLYEASVVGVARIGGNKGGSKLVFNYAAPQVKPDFGGRLGVHPGLKKALQLKEGPSDATGPAEETEDDEGIL